MKDEFFLRDDLLDFSSRLDSENHNVKAYRKRNRSSKHHQKLLQSTQVLTDLARIDLSQHTQGQTEVLSARRLSATAAVTKRPRAGEREFPGFTKTARTKHNSVVQETLFQSPQQRTIVNLKGSEIPAPPVVLKAGSFSQQEKQFAKGGLKNKHLENWLNQILLQYCHEQKFDSTIEHPALKKYGIDKNSLLSKGINPRNLERIYRSLFVYSMGFNTLLRQIGSKNMNLRKTFWKVYAILLEYCSDGDFDTMIGQIERDKLRKMDVLKEQIQRRQEIIDNNEDIHQERNAKIFKELKQLRDQNQDLQNDKNVLMQDFKQAEQAFNQQVSLRLKFENKINQIHGVHRELAIKHQKLYDDLQGKTYENNSLREKVSRLTQQFLTAKTDNQFLRKENASLKQENQFNYTLMDQMKKKTTGHELLQVEWRHKKEEFAIAIREREKRVEQIKGELKNAELMLAMREQSEQQLQLQYSRALEENKQLVSSLQKELQQINTFMLEKKDFNDTHSRLYAEVQVATKQLARKTQQLQEQKKEIDSLREELNNKNIDMEILSGKVRQHQADMKDLYSKIADMKQIKTIIEEELVQARNREEYYRNYYLEKEKAMTVLTQKAEEDQRIIAEFNIARKTLESKVTLLTQKLTAQEESGKKKLDKMRDEMRGLQRQNKSLKIELEEKLNQVEKATLLYQDTFHKLKDQLFQRNDLELRYNQSLSVVESETDHIKKLNIRISQMQEHHEDMTRKLKTAEFVLENREKAFQSELHTHLTANNHLKEQIRQRKMYIHPMKIEDLLSQINRMAELNEKERNAAEAEKKRLNVPALQAKIRNLQAEVFENEITHKQELARKDREIEIQRYRVRQLQQKYQKAPPQEGLSGSSQSNSKNYFKEKEQKYMQIIREKAAQVEGLLKEVETMHDQNNILLSRIGEIEAQSKLKDSRLEAFESRFSQLESERHALNMEKTNVFKEKQKLLAQLAQQESRVLDPQENRGFLGLPSTSNREIHSRQKSSRLDNPSRESESREKVTQPGWRNDFNKKVKNAYNYYKK